MAALEREVEAVAAHQAGAFARRQAVAVGATTQAIHRRVGSGAWVRLRPPKTYRLTARPPSWEQRLWAAWLWGGEGAAVSHRAAAALLGLQRFEPGPVELSVAVGANHRCPGARVHEARLAPGELRRVWGLVVTGPERTLVDLAGHPRVSPDVLDDAMESAFNLGLTTPERLEAALGGDEAAPCSTSFSWTGRRGGHGAARSKATGTAWCATAGWSSRCASSRCGRAPSGTSWTTPSVNRRLAVELDGFAKLSTKAAKQGLLARDTNLRLAGWTVLHFTWEDVRLRPEWVLGSLHLALGRPPGIVVHWLPPPDWRTGRQPPAAPESIPPLTSGA